MRRQVVTAPVLERRKAPPGHRLPLLEKAAATLRVSGPLATVSLLVLRAPDGKRRLTIFRRLLFDVLDLNAFRSFTTGETGRVLPGNAIQEWLL